MEGRNNNNDKENLYSSYLKNLLVKLEKPAKKFNSAKKIHLNTIIDHTVGDFSLQFGVYPYCFYLNGIYNVRQFKLITRSAKLGIILKLVKGVLHVWI